MSLIKYLNPNAIKDGSISSSKIADMSKSITWDELKTLRNTGRLVPGQQYRIIDYQCTTTQEGTKSAGHQFDIIVTADSKSVLNEEARAIKHIGDNYFNECDLNAWKLWYCLDNDTNRFAWADGTNGRGVIYRMIDEWNNDVPYDFKNIIYVVVPYILYGQQEDKYRTYKFTRDASIDMSIDGTQYYGYIAEYKPYGWYESENKCWVKEENPSTDSVLYNNDGSVIQFRYGGTLVKVNSDTYETYTFGKGTDSSTSYNVCGYDGMCYNNIILPYYKVPKLILNNNTFDYGCYNNTLWTNCYNNTFKKKCYNNSFGSDCNNNYFEYDCYNNSFGSNCNNNSFYPYFLGNSFGNDCCNNSFKDSCYNNSFANDCSKNSFGYRCSYNSFGDNCSYIKFASDSSATTKYNYYQHNHFGDGCKYIVFKGAETASNSARVQNYNFSQGLQGTSSAYLTIDGVRNRSYETKVAKNSNGELKIYCEADLVQ